MFHVSSEQIVKMKHEDHLATYRHKRNTLQEEEKVEAIEEFK